MFFRRAGTGKAGLETGVGDHLCFENALVVVLIDDIICCRDSLHYGDGAVEMSVGQVFRIQVAAALTFLCFL